MKLFFTLFILLSFGFFTRAQPVNPVEPPKEITKSPLPEGLLVTELEYDFGKIPQGKPVNHTFIIKNISSAPFALENVMASCGCTTPEWSKEVINPGASSRIVVGYNAASEGNFNKSITVNYNGNQTKMISIKGEVWKTPVSSAPSNTAVEFLKSQH